MKRILLLSTGGTIASVASELGRFSPSEVLRWGENVDCDGIHDALYHRLSCCVDEGEEALFRQEACEQLLQSHFKATIEKLGLATYPLAAVASGALLQTLLDLQKNDLAHIRRLQYYTGGKFMELDMDARRNLGAILLGEVHLHAEQDDRSDLIKGDFSFGFEVTVTPRAKSLTAVVSWTDEGFETYFAGFESVQ